MAGALLAGDVQDGRREIDISLLAVEVRGEPAARLHAVELLEEVDMEIGAAELAVGHRLEAKALLEAHDVADREVLDLAQLFLRDRALLVPLARLEQLLRAQEAADVIGAEGRRGALCHLRLRGSSRSRSFRTRCSTACRR